MPTRRSVGSKHGVIAERYKALGGNITLIAKPGVGHVHGLDDSTPLVEFLDNHCQAQFTSLGREGMNPVRLGSRRELFVDRHLIDRLDGARLHMHEPRDEGSRFDSTSRGKGCTRAIRR